MKDNLTTSTATLVVVCYSCCGDPQPTCKRRSGTGADPNPGGAR
jgi:hypothetical protein